MGLSVAGAALAATAGSGTCSRSGSPPRTTTRTVPGLNADPLLKADVDAKKVTITGAYFSLDTGVVSWL